MEASINPSSAIAKDSDVGLRVAVKLPVLGVMLFGVLVLYCVGFSAMTRAHNATHDTRHANGFPCH
jgi:cobalt transporter subunit CbtB